jgi:hypothetical protein
MDIERIGSASASSWLVTTHPGDDRARAEDEVPGDGGASSDQTIEVFEKTRSPFILRPCCDAGTGMSQRRDRRGSTRGDQLVCRLRESRKDRH